MQAGLCSCCVVLLLCCTVCCVVVLYSLCCVVVLYSWIDRFICLYVHDVGTEKMIRMIEPKNRELKAVRIEVAIGICIKFPTLYPKHVKFSCPMQSEDEFNAWKILRSLMELEPCIKHILDFYYKRELR